jgi:hypothetical protein
MLSTYSTAEVFPTQEFNIKEKLLGWQNGSSGRVPAQKAWIPSSNPITHTHTHTHTHVLTHTHNIITLIKLWEHKQCKKKCRIISESGNSFWHSLKSSTRSLVVHNILLHQYTHTLNSYIYIEMHTNTYAQIPTHIYTKTLSHAGQHQLKSFSR